MRPFYRDVPIKNNDYEFDDDPDKDEGIPMNGDEYNHHDDIEDQELGADFSDSERNERKIKVKSRAKRTKSVKRKKKRICVEEEEEEEIKPETSVFTESVAVPQELDPTDPVDAFLLSIGATLKTFNPYHLNLAKSKIFAVVQEHDLQQIVQRRDSHIEQKICTSDTMVFLNNAM